MANRSKLSPAPPIKGGRDGDDYVSVTARKIENGWMVSDSRKDYRETYHENMPSISVGKAKPEGDGRSSLAKAMKVARG